MQANVEYPGVKHLYDLLGRLAAIRSFRKGSLAEQEDSKRIWRGQALHQQTNRKKKDQSEEKGMGVSVQHQQINPYDSGTLSNQLPCSICREGKLHAAGFWIARVEM
jgi:hypothetical protein